MTDDDVAFYQLAQGIGSLVFFLLLIVVAVQYRRRLRQVKRLTAANGALLTQLAAATARLDEVERWRDRPMAPLLRAPAGPGPAGRHGAD